MKAFRYFFEALLLQTLFWLFKILGPEKSSALGGWIGRSIGPRLATSRKARRNLLSVFPAMSKEEQDRIITGMWDNLGRVIAEYPHLETISLSFTEIENDPILQDIIANKTGAVFIGGHFANWEIPCITMLTRYDHDIALTYRAPNNPWVEKMLQKSRTLNGRLKAFPKSQDSGRHILQTLKNKTFLGILIDQKYNEGMETPFFGRPAMTNPVFVHLAQKYNCPLIPVQTQRLERCHFKLTLHPPLKLFDEKGVALPVEDVITQAHTLLEDWVSQKPEQWLWLHRRWKD